MAEESEQASPKGGAGSGWRAALLNPGTLAGGIAIGVIGTAVWEILLRPGGSWCLRALLDLLTLGSHKAQDSVYTSAACDPTSSPQLALMMAMSGAPAGLWIGTLIAALRRSRLLATAQAAGKVPKRQVSIPYAAFMVGLSLCAFVPFAMLNESVSVWRIFAQELAIVSPYLQESERLTLRARFAQVQGKAEFIKLEDEMRAIAKTHGVWFPARSTW